jgi:hypothetical protein
MAAAACTLQIFIQPVNHLHGQASTHSVSRSFWHDCTLHARMWYRYDLIWTCGNCGAACAYMCSLMLLTCRCDTLQGCLVRTKVQRTAHSVKSGHVGYAGISGQLPRCRCILQQWACCYKEDWVSILTTHFDQLQAIPVKQRHPHKTLPASLIGLMGGPHQQKVPSTQVHQEVVESCSE